MDSLEDCISLLLYYGIATDRHCYFILPLPSEVNPVSVSHSSVTPWSLAETEAGKSIGSCSAEVRLWTVEQMLLANT